MKTKIKPNNKISYKLKKSNLIIRIICAGATFLLLLISFITFGWFMNSNFSETTSVELSSNNEMYELASKGTTGKYDSYLNAINGTEIKVKNIKDEELTLISTNGQEIKWMMNSESNIGNDSFSNGIKPDSFGKLTFYVIAKKSGTLNISFSLETILYDSEIENINNGTVNPNDCIILKEDINDFVKGHILFFEDYNTTTKIYSGRISNKFYFSENVLKDTAYPIDIYWVWPNVVDQLILPKNDKLLTENNLKRLIADDDETFETDLKTNTKNYFLSEETDFEFDTVIDILKQGSNTDDFNQNSYEILNEMWNNADSKIGTEVAYIELKIIGLKCNENE